MEIKKMDDQALNDFEFIKKISGGKYSIREAALLINNINPLSHRDAPEPEMVKDAIMAMKNDILRGVLNAKVRNNPRQQLIDEAMHHKCAPDKDETKRIDENLSTIHEKDLVLWIESRNLKPPFFFPQPKIIDQSKSTADVFDSIKSSKKRYSIKLHAAVSAWMAMENGAFDKNKTPKQIMTQWILDQFGAEGIKESAAQTAAEVANWEILPKKGINNTN